MLGLDTNVVIRYLVQDETDQAATAAEVIDTLTATTPGFISLVTTVEIFWVLRRAYQVDAAGCADLIDRLLNVRELRIDHADVVRSAVDHSRTGADFADAVVAELGRLAGCQHTVTLDRRAARLAGMHLLA